MGVKKILMYIIIFAFMCSIGNYGIEYTIGKKIENQSPYYLAFASIDANIIESRMDCWAKIDSFSPSEELVIDMKKIVKNLDLPLDPEKIIETNKKEGGIVQYDSKIGSQNFRIIIKTDQQLRETYYILSFSSLTENNKFYKYAEILKEMPGLKWKMYFLNTGTIEGIIKYDSQEEIINVVLKKLEANKKETYKDGKVTSITAYSDLVNRMNPYLTVEAGKYNIQVAVRVNEREKKTYVYIGNPLILGNY